MNLIIVLSSSLLLSFVLGAVAGATCSEDRRTGGHSLSGRFWPQIGATTFICWVGAMFTWVIYLASWEAMVVATGVTLVCALSFCTFHAIGGGGRAAA
jgi:hypothetical protein